MHHLIYCTCPDKSVATAIATRLVTEKLAACVNIFPGVQSLFEWQDQIEIAEEHLLLIKSPKANYVAIEAMIRHLHPYDLPEIIAVAIERGSDEYLKWIDSCLSIN